MASESTYVFKPEMDMASNEAVAKGIESAGDRSDWDAINVDILRKGRDISKSMFLSEENGQASNAQEQLEYNEANDVLRGRMVMLPPYDPDTMAQIAENSSALGPNIAAYIINIDSYGHTLKPVIDLTSADADQKIEQALRYQNKKQPTPAEVQERKKELELEISDERQKLEAFFENCAPGLPFSGPEGLRGLTRLDLEVTGNAYWEVIRNGLSEVVAFNRLPSRSMRMTRLDPNPVQTEVNRRTSLLGVEKMEVTRRFRKYVQSYSGQYVQEGKTKYVYFKEFGDPRTISANTGWSYDTFEEFRGKEPDASAATEVLYFKISTPRSEYGIPRWIGVLLSVLGSRQAEEVNFMYFDNKSIPPLAVLVSGGRMSSDSVKRIEDYVNHHMKGRRNFHNILILEAESAQATQFGTAQGDVDNGRMKIELQPLTEAQQKDGLFLDYDERNADKVGQVFRLPRLLRGDVRDFNKGTAQASLDFSEVQVFTPLRQQFDWVMNRLIFEMLDCRYHEFVSNAATIKDPQALSTMITDLTKVNVLTPEEARELAQEVFHKSFLKLDAEWTKQPIGITVSGANQALARPGAGQQGQGAGELSVSGAGGTQAELGAGHNGAETTKADTNKVLASAIQKLHDRMIEMERQDYLKREREVVRVPDDIFFSLATPDSAK